MAESSTYQRKRRFERTPEPAATFEGDVDPGTARPGERFVIHQHYATRLHHDLRLEMWNGDTPVLVSWAVPKGLPTKRGVRVLAIHVEDHPFEYRTFTGTIPGGEYGAGEVRIFDEGTYEMLEREPGKIGFRLKGRRLRGVYRLILTEMDGRKEQWLGLLSQDERPPPEPAPPPDPMLCTLAADAFDDPQWGFEPKWDGVRAIAVCDETTALISRNRHDITAGYPELSHLHDRLVALQAMVDGEIIALEDGVPSFQKLQGRMHLRNPSDVARAAKVTPVTYMAFDLLYLDGTDLTPLQLRERRELLEQTVVPGDSVQVSPTVTGEGTVLYEAAVAQALEGIVAKRLDARYEPGARSRWWLKIKTVLEADVVVLGWREGAGNRAGTIGSLVLGVYDGDRLRYVGNVGTGFNRESLATVEAALKDLVRPESPLDGEESRQVPSLRTTHWVEPKLVAQVEYRQLTDGGRLRAPSFRGLRTDKRPDECRFEDL